MQQRYTAWLIVTALVVALATYVVVPGTGVHFTLGSFTVNRDFGARQGLDLRGGLQVLLQADVPAGTQIDSTSMAVARQIVENRVNGLGVTEPLVQSQGTDRIVVELPGITDPQQAIDTLKQTGLLEFVDIGSLAINAGTPIKTDCIDPSKVDCGNPTGALAVPTTAATSAGTGVPATAPATSAAATSAPTTTPAATSAISGTANTAGSPTATIEPTLKSPASATPQVTATTASTVSSTVPSGPTYHTVMAGVAIKSASVSRSTLGAWVINFSLTDQGSTIFASHTSSHVGQRLAIVLDKTVISAPNIESAITGGSGTISGNFTQASANTLALQLRYGSLPVPLKVVQSQEIGPSLGQDSVRKSAIAGIIGMLVVGLFMSLYYRLPGLIAVLALLIYAVVTFALFILIPVTLTLPGIAGFVLSVGVAVDANILIFERMKEELRSGKPLRQAVEAGFSRAWPSIRDSNISTLITCAILFWFGNTFGASLVKGFALTLALGVGVSLFTAVLVTRTILHLFLDRVDFSARHSWFGI
jgi:preprotein translocase subunit SecD